VHWLWTTASNVKSNPKLKNDCHSGEGPAPHGVQGESRNPVISNNYKNTGHRFSPVRRLFTKPLILTFGFYFVFLSSHYPFLQSIKGVKKPGTWIKPKGQVDWRRFGAQPLKCEALLHNPA
jgi:hypothetical protein